MKTTPFQKSAFTMLEAMIAVAIFAMLMVSVSAIWIASWRAAERVMSGSGDEARADFVLKRLGDSIQAAVYHPEQKELYAWLSQDSGGGAGAADKISFVTARSPDSAVAAADYSPLERIQIEVHNGENGKRQLVMLAAPFTMDEGEWQREIVLLENVNSFRVQYWSESRAEWSDGWSDEDHGPLAVRMAISVGEEKGGDWRSMSHTMTARVDAMYAKQDVIENQTAPGTINLQPVPTPPGGTGAAPAPNPPPATPLVP